MGTSSTVRFTVLPALLSPVGVSPSAGAAVAWLALSFCVAARFFVAALVALTIGMFCGISLEVSSASVSVGCLCSPPPESSNLMISSSGKNF